MNIFSFNNEFIRNLIFGILKYMTNVVNIFFLIKITIFFGAFVKQMIFIFVITISTSIFWIISLYVLTNNDNTSWQ